MRRLLARTPLSRSRRFARAVKPHSYEGLVTLGSGYGCWTVPLDLLGPDSIVYSAGVGLDITFDLELIERVGCSVYAFDPTPAALRHVEQAAAGEDRFRLFPWAIWSSDTELALYAPDWGTSNYSAVNLHASQESFTAPARSVSSVMTALGHDHVDLLKLDIEGAEYEVLASVRADGIEIRLLCVEFHKNPSIADMKRTVSDLRGSGFTPIHVHRFDVTFVGA